MNSFSDILNAVLAATNGTSQEWEKAHFGKNYNGRNYPLADGTGATIKSILRHPPVQEWPNPIPFTMESALSFWKSQTGTFANKVLLKLEDFNNEKEIDDVGLIAYGIFRAYKFLLQTQTQKKIFSEIGLDKGQDVSGNGIATYEGREKRRSKAGKIYFCDLWSILDDSGKIFEATFFRGKFPVASGQRVSYKGRASSLRDNGRILLTWPEVQPE